MEQPLSCYNPTTEKIGKTFAYGLIFFVSPPGNTFITITVYKTKTMEKPINFLIINMAMPERLLPISRSLRRYKGSKQKTGRSMVLLARPRFSGLVSTHILVLVAVDRFGVVVFTFCPPLVSSKLCRFFILASATWIVAVLILSRGLVVTKRSLE